MREMVCKQCVCVCGGGGGGEVGPWTTGLSVFGSPDISYSLATLEVSLPSFAGFYVCWLIKVIPLKKKEYLKFSKIWSSS